jgi:hypothetical protein
MLFLHYLPRFGDLTPLAPISAELLGRKPQSLEAYIHDNQARWQ